MRLMESNVQKWVSAALKTINAPRAREATEIVLLTAILTAGSEDATQRRLGLRWRAHLCSLFDEVPVATLHHMVLAGAFTFPELQSAVREYSLGGERNVPWIEEMASIYLAATSAAGSNDTR
ncbi:hypothetical protein AA14337_3389 [Acetobacter malorum DSM 14337]|uniref:Uncharacterized protein n=1 Tax=Acetobacter malorum DSM 14337 TaxID=1307910 RepID=A0ABQ0Q196_9PROT|nr:hypothetical protein AA14337_3389 [Acetobacter malorum DSM 14337]